MLGSDEEGGKLWKKLLEIGEADKEAAKFYAILSTKGFQNELMIHMFYPLVSCPPNNEDGYTLLEQEYLWHLALFIENMRDNRICWTPSKILAKHIMKIIILYLNQEIQFGCCNQRIVERSRDILKIIYDSLTNSYAYEMTDRIQGLVLECLVKMRRLGKQNIGMEFLAQFLSKTSSETIYFEEFFKQYLTQPKGQLNTHTFTLLLKGFANRIPVLMGEKQTEFDRNTLLRLYSSLAKFLYKLPSNSPWLGFLLEPQFRSIKESLCLLASKKVSPELMAQTLDLFIITYARSTFSKETKFEYVLETIKFVLNKTTVLYGFMKYTDEIQDNKDFLRWFVARDLRPEKQTQIIETYTANKFALQFMLTMMIFYNHHEPGNAQYLAGLMRSVNLLEEAKYFIYNQETRQFLSTFYALIGDEEGYRQFESIILGAHLKFEL